MNTNLWDKYAANENWKGLIKDRGYYVGEYPNEIRLFIYSMIDLRKQAKKYHCGLKCKKQTSFESFLSYYAGAIHKSVSSAEKVIFEACYPHVIRHTTEVFNDLLDQYELDAKTLARVFGFRRTDFVKITKGERSVPRDLLMCLLMFLEYDLDQCEEVLADCGIALSNCIPDCIFKDHIAAENFSIAQYADDVFKAIEFENSTLKELDQDPIALPSFFRAGRSYPEYSVSDYYDGERYDYKEGLHDTAEDFI